MGNYGYGGPPPMGYGPVGYGYGPGNRPPKKGLGPGAIAVFVVCGLFGTCIVSNAIGGAKNKSSATAAASPDPSAQAMRAAAAQKANEEANAAREKSAVETFPTAKSDIATRIKKASTAAAQTKWPQANTELSAAEASLSTFTRTSIAESKDFQDLDAKAQTLRKKIAPQIAKLEQEAAAASAEKELKESSVVVSSMQLWSDYQANEVAADNKYKGRPLLVSGSVASIEKGPFGGLVLWLATGNMFERVMCDMNNSEKSDMASLSRGQQVRVLCTGSGMTIGSPTLDRCSFR